MSSADKIPANATADLTAKQFANNKYTIPNSSGFFAMVAVAKPAAEDGNISMFVCNQYKSYDLSFKLHLKIHLDNAEQ